MYHRREFTTFDVEMTQIALMAFSFALLGWSLIKVLAPGYYARQDTKAPVKVAMRALALTMVLNLIVVAALAWTGNLKSQGAHALLALTNGVGAIFNATLLYVGLRRKNILHRHPGGVALLVKIGVASGAMAGFLYWFGGALPEWLAASTAERALWLAWLVAGGGAVYFGVLWLCGVRLLQFKVHSPLAAR
jgi:putative peptidoglycan lipid II flippase